MAYQKDPAEGTTTDIAVRADTASTSAAKQRELLNITIEVAELLEELVDISKTSMLLLKEIAEDLTGRNYDLEGLGEET